MSLCSHVLLQAGQCVGRLTLCLGVPSICESPAPAVTCDLCGTGSWGGILERKGGLTAASCHPLQGAGSLARVHDGSSPELGATSRARCQGLQEQALWGLCIRDPVGLRCVPQQCDLVSALPWLLHGCLYPGCVPEFGGMRVRLLLMV